MGVLDSLDEFSSMTQVLRQVDEILHHDMGLRDALGLILKVMAEGIGADSSSLLMLARGRDEFVIAASYGLPEEVAKKARIKLKDRSVAAWVLQNGESLRLEGPLRDVRFEGANPHIVSSIIVPVYLSGECIGVLSVSNRTAQKRFTDRDLRLLQEISSHIAILVERLRLEVHLIKALEGTRLLNEAAAKLHDSRDVAALFSVLAGALPRLVGVECRAALYLASPYAVAESLSSGLEGPALEELERLPERLAQRAMRVGHAAYAAALSSETAYRGWARRHEIASGLALPLAGKKGTLGALELYTGVAYRFPPEEVWVLDNLAQLAAVAIENFSLSQSLETEQNRSVQHEKLATLGQLAAGIAHEIQNPLSGILGYAQLLKKSLRDYPQVQQDLDKIERETGRLRELAYSMMSCARPVEFLLVSLHEVIDMALNILHCEIKKHGAEIHKVYNPLPAFRCDPGQMEQMFINIILNALQSFEGRPERRVTIKTFFSPEHHSLEFEIEDTGCGIAPEHLPRIFEPQFTTKAADRGNGLGLAMVQGAVKRHGGEISVTSEIGRGTTVRLSFPRQ